jgi:hypothetical protein
MQTIATSLERMVTQRMKDPDTETLLAWLQAIATGGAVECEGKRLTLRSSLSVACSIKLDTEFVNKHGALAEAFRSAASRSKGKWHLAAAAAMCTHHISRKRDVVAFLLHCRRVAAR